MAIDSDQFFRQQHRIPVLFERFAIGFALHLRGAIEHCLHGAEFLDQLHAALVADARRAGNVIHRIAAQSHHVHNLVRRHAQGLRHFFRIENQVVFLRIQDLYALGNQLHHVFVAGDDEDLVLLLGRFARQRADHVVGLKALGLENGNAQRFKRAANIWNLAPQILRHSFALGFVPLVAYVFEALRL